MNLPMAPVTDRKIDGHDGNICDAKNLIHAGARPLRVYPM